MKNEEIFLNLAKDEGLKDDSPSKIDESVVIKLGGGTPEVTLASTPSLDVSGEVNRPEEDPESARVYLTSNHLSVPNFSNSRREEVTVSLDATAAESHRKFKPTNFLERKKFRQMMATERKKVIISEVDESEEKVPDHRKFNKMQRRELIQSLTS